MNFLEHVHKAFTYRSLVIVFVAWIVLLALVYGFLLFRVSSLRSDVTFAQKNIEQLNAEKDKILSMVESLGKNNVSAKGAEDLAGIIYARPRWSSILRQLTKSLPPQVWLSSVGVTPVVDEELRLEVSGNAKSQRELTNFIMRLESSGMFRKTELMSTKRTDASQGLFEYGINTTPVFSKFN